MTQVAVEFAGGLDLLFGKVDKLQLTLEKGWNMKKLIEHLRDNYLKERTEMFVSGDSVRPGILVCVNDTDWDLLGDLDYVLADKDHVLFISTLHGG